MIRVWDFAVRAFHWLLVVLVSTSLVTGNIGGSAMLWHERSGITILTLLLFRWIWGVVGSTTARFSYFLHGPMQVAGFLRLLFRGEPHHRLGHNPLGGWMVLLLLLSLTLQATTGLFGNDDIFVDGPLAHLITRHSSDLATTIHRYGATVLMSLIVIHVAAVLLHLLIRREGLLRPMFTGKREWPRELPSPVIHFPNPWLAPGILLLVAALVAAVLWRFGA